MAQAGEQHAPTPRLDALLNRLRGTLLRNVWLYGFGTTIAATCAWLVFMYAADRTLKLPVGIRVIHLAVLVFGAVYLLRRTFFSQRAKVPGRVGLAMLAQRSLPEDAPRDDRFVSALQLRESVAATDTAAPLVARVAREAEGDAERADLARVTDSKVPTRRMAGGVVAGVVAVAVFAQDPAMSRIFAARMIGGDVAWPRNTTITVDVPTAAGGLDVERGDEVIRVRAARGSDVPLVARAEGEIPDAVTIRFDSGAVIDVSRSGEDSYRTILPSIQEDTSVRVTGGDDQRGVPRIDIEVLQPPDLAGLAFFVEPPAYSGLPERLERSTSIQVLQGSRVTVHVQPDPADATGVARTFPDDEVIELASSKFPVDEAAEPAGDVVGLSFSRTVDESMRFRIELLDSTGLENPDPALFGIEVTPDRRAELITLAPARADVEVVAGGAVPLRVLVRDDFGLGELTYESRDLATDTVRTSAALSLEPQATDSEFGGRSARAAALGRQLVEIADLAGGELVTEGMLLLLQARVTDTRAPEPNETLSGPIRIRVVSADEFLRAQRDGLGRAAEDVGAVDGRIESTLLTLGDFALVAGGDEAEVPDAGRVATVCNGARRVQGDLRSIARSLSGLAESLVYARVDDRSGALEARLWELTSGATERSFDEETWRTLGQELASGRLGSPERAGDLVRVVGMALDAAGDRAETWITALEAVRRAEDVESARNAIDLAAKETEALREAIAALGAELGEWDSMQSILSLTRDILNRQKNVKEKAKAQAESER